MAYTVRIDTTAYRDRRCSKSNWEPGTMNDYMHAINGWKVRENNLKEVGWRIHFFGHSVNSAMYNDEGYEAWEIRHAKKNKIKYYDRMCEFDRTDNVTVYGFAQGYVNVDAVIKELKENGVVQIPFKRFYDMRQYCKNMDGCYIEIRKS